MYSTWTSITERDLIQKGISCFRLKTAKIDKVVLNMTLPIAANHTVESKSKTTGGKGTSGPAIKGIGKNNQRSSAIDNDVGALNLYVMSLLAIISGQRPILTKARKSIANWKLRKNQILGCKVTLRGKPSLDFLDKTIRFQNINVQDTWSSPAGSPIPSVLAIVDNSLISKESTSSSVLLDANNTLDNLPATSYDSQKTTTWVTPKGSYVKSAETTLGVSESRVHSKIEDLKLQIRCLRILNLRLLELDHGTNNRVKSGVFPQRSCRDAEGIVSGSDNTFGSTGYSLQSLGNLTVGITNMGLYPELEDLESYKTGIQNSVGHGGNPRKFGFDLSINFKNNKEIYQVINYIMRKPGGKKLVEAYSKNIHAFPEHIKKNKTVLSLNQIIQLRKMYLTSLGFVNLR